MRSENDDSAPLSVQRRPLFADQSIHPHEDRLGNVQAELPILILPVGRPVAPGAGDLVYLSLGIGAPLMGQFLDPFVDLFAWGILERHPQLRRVMAESGVGWLPWIVQELDYRFWRLWEAKEIRCPER